MGFLLLFFLLVSSEKVVEVRWTDTAPRIDGIIEDIWQSADSAYGFIQHSPYEKELPTEKTVVYVLQDKDNLYVAFRCYAQNHNLAANLGRNADNVTLYIDPFGSKTIAYYFKVYANGGFDDGMMLDDGRSEDNSWDGVWSRAVKVYDDCYEVEIRIPFRSIRYKQGLTEWGINFKRYIPNNQETIYWTEVLQIEENMVSKYGRLKGISPQSTGYYFELYPEGFLRYDKDREKEGRVKPSGSLNFKWDLTSQTTLNATVLPDFAQIESDPFTLNLSRYEVWLDERRPFFLEGKDIFRMSNFGQGKGFYYPLNIFYSRRIGKSINGEPVPILGGLKLTNKSEDWNLGAFGAYTDSLKYLEDDTMITEPRRSFGVLRVKRKVLETSNIGMLFSGTRVDKDNYNYAFGLDGAYRSGVNQFIFQGALSDRNKKKGWAISSGYFGFVKGFLTLSTLEVVQDSFDVDDIGFVSWVGMKKFMFGSGPFRTYQRGFLKNLFIAPLIVVVQEPGSKNWSKVYAFTINPNFRNRWGFSLNCNVGQYFEEGIEYLQRGINLSVWGNGTNYHLNFGGNYSYGYNYSREFLAYQGSNWFWGAYNAIPRIRLSLSLNNWVEWDTLNRIIAITSKVTPRFDFTISKDIKVGIFNEFVMETPETNLGEAELISNRVGLLLSWNFSPKSWLYIALNDHREQNDERKLELQNQIGAIKAKYLLYF
ncbi:MAG: DUF5916 domain-containing protein [candidate division WOR-3 bacterium]|nr:DUF5916 domain-containing protein [candidate division WOR-3 bacterium]